MSNFEEVSRYFTSDIPDDLKQIISDSIQQSFESNKLIKAELLEEARKKEPHFFYQADGFAGLKHGDDIMQPDDDGDCVVGGSTWELKNSTNEVRVLIHEDAKPEDVIRLLKKIRKWFKKCPGLITDNSEHSNLLNRIKSRKEESDEIPF